LQSAGKHNSETIIEESNEDSIQSKDKSIDNTQVKFEGSEVSPDKLVPTPF
jgi:hypothetical protein